MASWRFQRGLLNFEILTHFFFLLLTDFVTYQHVKC
jgi:hypothetical protein